MKNLFHHVYIDHVEDNDKEDSDNRRNNADGFVKPELTKQSGPKFAGGRS